MPSWNPHRLGRQAPTSPFESAQSNHTRIDFAHYILQTVEEEEPTSSNGRVISVARRVALAHQIERSLAAGIVVFAHLDSFVSDVPPSGSVLSRPAARSTYRGRRSRPVRHCWGLSMPGLRAAPAVVRPLSCFPTTAVTNRQSWGRPCRCPSPHAIRQPGQTKEPGGLTALQCALLSRIM